MNSDDLLTCCEDPLIESNKDDDVEEEYEEAPMLEGRSEVGGAKAEDDDELLYTRSAERNYSEHRWSSHWPAPRPWGLAGNPYFSSWPYRHDRPAAIVGAGLENLGNTCFLNAVMQCFIHTVPLLHGVLSDKHSDCDKESFCLVCAMRWLINHSLTRRNGPVAPLRLVDNLSYFSSGFKRFQQEDAHEFLQCFLERLESCNVSSESDNVVNQIFGGRLVSKLKCCSCGHCSDTYEPSIDLSLEIGDADNLLTALQSFTKVEKIEDPDTKFTCEKCKEQVSIEKQLSFDKAPTVALFQLKRFKNDGCLVHKIDKHVAFPLDMDLQPFTSGGNNSTMELKYVLYAVVVHVGMTSTSGHYYSFIRLSPEMWCKFDDSRVELVSEDYVLSQEAYILYYAKEDTPWFSNFVETQEYFNLDSKAWDASPKSVLDRVHTSPLSPILENKSSRDIGSELREVDPSNEMKDGEQLHDNLKTNENTDGNLCAGPSLGTPSPEAQKELFNTYCEKLNGSKEEKEANGTASNHINTPEYHSRSPSPEIYREDPPDAGFMIPRGHLKTVACKRRLENDMDDLETKQAYSFIRKSMPRSRGLQMMAALKGSKLKAPENRKRSRKLGKNDSTIRPVARPLIAGTHRWVSGMNEAEIIEGDSSSDDDGATEERGQNTEYLRYKCLVWLKASRGEGNDGEREHALKDKVGRPHLIVGTSKSFSRRELRSPDKRRAADSGDSMSSSSSSDGRRLNFRPATPPPTAVSYRAAKRRKGIPHRAPTGCLAIEGN
ncbi:ubiquitin carboxyl-terminal hydrolase [Striga asiatica]|uniref:Ubiquitin carboxyl-terminal hydrolase n=1 Tax=Striga asiatica TaxID=4170 RepID=A0A5A7QFH3_STRAF|nr:ubiquitin carboxyl-terminal hydrolase [Striga asiatica]